MTLAFHVGIKALDVTADSPTTVYVSTNGSNSNSGTNTAPYATFQYALSKVENGGMIVLTTVFSVLFLKEKLSRKQIFGILTGIVAIILISIG